MIALFSRGEAGLALLALFFPPADVSHAFYVNPILGLLGWAQSRCHSRVRRRERQNGWHWRRSGREGRADQSRGLVSVALSANRATAPQNWSPAP